MIRSFPPHPNPLPCLRRSGFAQAGPRGEGRPFIPPAELGGILAYFDKKDGLVKSPKSVTPARAGVQTLSLRKQGTIQRNWIPVFTGNPGFLLSQE
jgi:hypothetical protein